MATRYYKSAEAALQCVLESEPEDQDSSEEDAGVVDVGGDPAAVHESTESTDESSDDESSDDDNREASAVSDSFVSKSSTERWSSIAPSARQARSQNIVKGKCGPTSYAKQRVSADNTLVDCFYVFFSQRMIDHIIECTNREGSRVKEEAWIAMCQMELKAFLGLLLLRGVYRASGELTEELWSADGRKDFPSTMTFNRFRDIRRFIRFDNTQTRAQRVEADRLAAISELWSMFLHSAQGAMIPGPFLTIDERLAPYRGRCKFVQYMPSKPAKYGIKLWMCCDAETKYVYNASIYCGKESADAAPTKDLGGKVVRQLLEPLHCEGRNITTDNFFTSLALARDILKAKKASMVGTIRTNRVELPKEFVTPKGRALYSSLIGFNETGDSSLVSYKCKKNKVVVVLSTMHVSNMSVGKEPKNLPEVINFYNKTKVGVDCADQMIETYSTKFSSRRWPVVLFCNLLDIAALNAYVLYEKLKVDGAPREDRRLFIKKLGKGLCQELQEQRRSDSTHPGLIRARLLNDTQEPPKKRGRCHVCPRQTDKKAAAVCNSCHKNVCPVHSEIFCETCLSAN
jgi:hypothetical protein